MKKLFERGPAEKNPCLGIRSFVPELREEDYGRSIPRITDEHLDLRRHFEGRFIREDRLWDDAVVPELREFLRQYEVSSRPIDLVFAAHASIAFAAGWALQPKSGLRVAIHQPTVDSGIRIWSSDDGSEKSAGNGQWQARPDVLLRRDQPDIALVLSVTRDIGHEIAAFIEAAELPVGRLVAAVPAEGAGPNTIGGGGHSLQLAIELSNRVTERRPQERRGHLHVFACAPNALLFHLGRLSRGWGTFSLYEYPFGSRDTFAEYERSITLPPFPHRAGLRSRSLQPTS